MMDIAELRRAAAAVAPLPDEGMRGTSADSVKAAMAYNPFVLAAIRRALMPKPPADRSDNGEYDDDDDGERIAAAAALVRSISITPQRAASVARIVSPSLASALEARLGLRWVLPATARLAQHAECHPYLLHAGAVHALERNVARGPETASTEVAVRLDLVACAALAFLSDSDPSASRAVPPSAVPAFVDVLGKRLRLPPGPDAADVCASSRHFFGLPLYYRPRFLLQALAALVRCDELGARGGGGRGTATAGDPPLARAEECVRSEDLREILLGLHQGTLSNDAGDNVPYGSPDAVEMAGRLSAGLLRCTDLRRSAATADRDRSCDVWKTYFTREQFDAVTQLAQGSR